MNMHMRVVLASVCIDNINTDKVFGHQVDIGGLAPNCIYTLNLGAS